MFVFKILTLDFALRLAVTTAAIATLIQLGFATRSAMASSRFLLHVFGFGVFFVTYSLKFEEMSLGFAFGLFAIFSMLRYRTEQLGIKEMTYLFIVIVCALLGGVSPLSPVELPAVLGLIVLLVVTVEKLVFNHRFVQHTLRYEKIENIRPERRAQLLKDLQERTGLEVRDLRVDTIDFVQDSAMLTIVCALPTGTQ